MKKILYLTSANPFGIGGGSFANHAYLKALSEIFKGEIDVLSAKEWESTIRNDIKVSHYYFCGSRPAVRILVSPLTGEICRFSRPASKILEQHNSEYSHIISNGSSISGNIYKLAKKLGVKLITIHHNHEPEYFVDNSKGLKKWLYLPQVKRLERLAYKNSDYNLFLTNQDFETFKTIYGESKGVCNVIGVFESTTSSIMEFSDFNIEQPTVVITGSLCTMQGIDGIKYFFGELYKHLPKNFKVVIAGRDPSEEVVKLCDSHSNVTLVSNPSGMSKVISCGDIYVCPTRLGGGLKLRVMDGLRLGLPVITHTCSARGYDAMKDTGDIYVFSNPTEFKLALNKVISNMQNISKSKIAGSYNDVFSYDAGVRRMHELLQPVL